MENREHGQYVDHILDTLETLTDNVNELGHRIDDADQGTDEPIGEIILGNIKDLLYLLSIWESLPAPHRTVLEHARALTVQHLTLLEDARERQAQPVTVSESE